MEVINGNGTNTVSHGLMDSEAGSLTPHFHLAGEWHRLCGHTLDGGIEVMASHEIAPIENTILVVRGQRVILAGDLAKIYGVETRVLNQAVKRNRKRFPEDFTFRLTRGEVSAIAASRSQSVILKRGGHIKYLP